MAPPMRVYFYLSEYFLVKLSSFTVTLTSTSELYHSKNLLELHSGILSTKIQQQKTVILFLRSFSSKERKMLPKCILIAGLGIKQIDAYKNVYGDLSLLQANQVMIQTR